MATSPRVGVVMLSLSENTGIDRARWAEEHGYDSAWVADGGGRMHALTLMGGVAAMTERVQIGTAIEPVFTHTPAVLASATLALHHLSKGRFVLGLGASSQAMMERWNGIPFVKPLTRVKETVQALRGILAGEKTDFEGETLRTTGFRLNPPIGDHIPIYLAALRPRMLELAGEIADGVILHLAPLAALPRMLEHVAAGAERSGRSLADIDVSARCNVVVTDDPAGTRDEFRRFVLTYFSTGVYNKFLAWCGFEEEAARISEGFASGDRAKTQEALSDELIDRLAIIGDADECRARMREFIAAGLHHPTIYPATTDPNKAQATFEAFSRKHFP